MDAVEQSVHLRHHGLGPLRTERPLNALRGHEEVRVLRGEVVEDSGCSSHWERGCSSHWELVLGVGVGQVRGSSLSPHFLGVRRRPYLGLQALSHHDDH